MRVGGCAPEIEHPYRTICPTRCKNMFTPRHKRNIKHLPIMCNQMCFSMQRIQIPNCTCRIYTRRNNRIRSLSIPMKRRQRRGKLRFRLSSAQDPHQKPSRGAYTVTQGFHFDSFVSCSGDSLVGGSEFPETEMIACCCKEVRNSFSRS